MLFNSALFSERYVLCVVIAIMRNDCTELVTKMRKNPAIFWYTKRHDEKQT